MNRPPLHQQGQALIYGLFVLAGGLAALFFLFNTGQLSREKTKSMNAADAVAYSAGVLHARTLNFEAYTNRAMVANTVAISQLVSLSSWIQYTNNLATFGGSVINPKFVAFYPSYYAALVSGPYAQAALIDTGALDDLATASDNITRTLLMNAQKVAYAGLIPARQQVMDDVAARNYLNDGTVIVDPVPLTANEFTSFVSPYTGNDRTRFKEVAEKSAKKDGFVDKRTWILLGLYSDCPAATASFRFDWLSRRGGTELLGFDEWKAMDTLSEFRWVPKDKTDVFCQGLAETPDGWGLQSAADNPTVDLDPTNYDSSVIVNPGSSALALVTSSSSWNYSGLPDFYDLSQSALSENDPRLQFSIRVRRKKNQTVTSEGTSAIKPTTGLSALQDAPLNKYQATPAGGDELVAVATSEVYFERPNVQSANCSDGSTMGRNNCYGKSQGTPREIGSLFNPFWQVHLIQSDANVKEAQAMQGAVLP